MPIKVFEDNRESKKAKVIYETFFDEEVKYKHYTNVFFNRSNMSHEMNKIQSKNYNIGFYRVINKV